MKNILKPVVVIILLVGAAAAWQISPPPSGGGSGTVTSFSAGTLSPLFTTSVATSTVTPALSFSLTNAAPGTLFGNNGASAAAPGYTIAPVLGVAGSSVGSLGFANVTSGTITLSPVTGALGTVTLSLPAATDTLVGKATTDILTNKTLTTPTIGDFSNAGHNHTNAAGGGQLTLSAFSSTQGSGSVVGATSPTITTPTISGLLTDATGGCATISEQYGATATVGFAQGATTAQIGMTNGSNCSILYAVGTTPTFRMASGGLWAFSQTAGDATASLDTGLSRIGPGLLGIGHGTAGQTNGLYIAANKMFVASDFTTVNNTSLQTITGLSLALPASTAVNFSFHCSLNYSQATAAVVVAFGIQAANTAATQINANGTQYTSASVSATGTLNGLTTTTATNIVSGTPSAITTIWKAELDGTVEAPSNATPTTINWMVSTATGADAVTVKRGSYCTLY